MSARRTGKHSSLNGNKVDNQGLNNNPRNTESELEFMSLLLDIAKDTVFAFDMEGNIVYANEAAYTILGYEKQEFLDISVHKLFSDDSIKSIKSLLKFITRQGSTGFETYQLRKDGTPLPVEIQAQLAEFKGKKVIVCTARDLTERKEVQEIFNKMAFYNHLTGLPNRELLRDRLNVALAHASRNNGVLSILYLDLDNFKTVNDSLGHAVGDLLLKGVAKRLSKCLRENDTIAYLGGDEFVILLAQINEAEDAIKVARKVLDILKPAFNLERRAIHITTSIGIAIYPDDGIESQILMKNADMALNRAKELGRNNYQIYAPSLNAKAMERLALENSMREALENDEFVVYYQPQNDIHTGNVVGMEALVRWHHPDFGIIPPMEFIPLAEESGLIVQLGEVVLRKACKQAREWQDEGYPPVKVSVNISARQFQQINLAKMIKSVLRETGLNPKYLELELTESALMNDADAAIETIQKLKNIGIHIAIDDFGTGYSSLSRLRKFPIDTLKIDRSFISDIPTDSDGAKIASAIISLAHSLKLKAIAEGVETAEQIDLLSSLECDEVQGFVYSKPVPAEEAVNMLGNKKGLSA